MLLISLPFDQCVLRLRLAPYPTEQLYPAVKYQWNSIAAIAPYCANPNKLGAAPKKNTSLKRASNSLLLAHLARFSSGSGFERLRGRL